MRKFSRIVVRCTCFLLERNKESAIFSYNEKLVVCRNLMPDLPRRTSVDFLEHLVEQFVICKSMPFDDFHNAVIRVADIVVDMDQPDLVDVPCECHTEVLLKEAAEIFPAQTKLLCSFLKGDWFAVMIIYIGSDRT